MPTHRARSGKTWYTFILWGDKFEEKAAAIFVSELRKAGLCVKVVGLHGQRAGGKHGLILHADLTLGEALRLADKTVCVVIPCSAATLQRVENDPRIADFFRRTQSNQARFVVSDREVVAKSSLKKLLFSQDGLVCYGESSDLSELVREIAAAL